MNQGYCKWRPQNKFQTFFAYSNTCYVWIDTREIKSLLEQLEISPYEALLSTTLSSSSWLLLEGQGGIRSHRSEVPPGRKALCMVHNWKFLHLHKAGKQLSPQPEWQLLGEGVRKESQTHHILQGCLCSAAQRLSRAHFQLEITKVLKSGLQGSFKSNLKNCL